MARSMRRVRSARSGCDSNFGKLAIGGFGAVVFATCSYFNIRGFRCMYDIVGPYTYVLFFLAYSPVKSCSSGALQASRVNSLDYSGRCLDPNTIYPLSEVAVLGTSIVSTPLSSSPTLDSSIQICKEAPFAYFVQAI